MNADETIVEKAAFCAASPYALKIFLMLFGNVAGNIHFMPVIIPRSSASCLSYVKKQANGRCHARDYKLQVMTTEFSKTGKLPL